MNCKCDLKRQLLVVLALGTACLGCGRQEGIRQYRVPKEAVTTAEAPANESPEIDGDPAETAVVKEAISQEPTDRMLAALIQTPDRAWSFKLAGSVSQVAEYAGDFHQLIYSVKFTSDPADAAALIPTWTLPDGWEERPGSQMRFATLLPDPSKPSLAVSVVGLPVPQSPLANVNRWRGQLQLAAIAESELADSTERLKLGDYSGLMVDLEGHAAPGGMMGPMAMGNPQSTGSGPAVLGPPGAGPEGTEPPPTANAAAEVGSVAPIAGKPSSANGSSADAMIQVTPPESWKSLKPQMFQTHRWEIVDGDERAECSISPLGAAGADLLSNVNRWRGQIQLPSIESDGLKDVVTEMEIDGQPAKLVSLKQPEGTDDAESILGVIAMRGSTAWFVKLRGNQAFVERQQGDFEAFCKSIHFN